VVVERARLVQEAIEQPLVRVLQRLHAGTRREGGRRRDRTRKLNSPTAV
jgi:hypothetical protein